MAPPWCVHCASLGGSGYVHRVHNDTRAGQADRLSGEAASPLWWRKEQGAARCARCNVHDASSASPPWCAVQGKHLDRTPQWGRSGLRLKRGSRLPDPRLRLKEVVDAQVVVAIVDAWTDHGAAAPSARTLSLDHADQLVGGRGCDNPQSFTPKLVKTLCQQGQVKRAVEVLESLGGGTTTKTSSGIIDKHLLYSVLKECVSRKDLVLGGQVHAVAVRVGLGSDTFLCNHFIRMYAAHGKLREAMDVFRGVALPDAFMWSSIISAHAKQGQAERAIQLYQHMRGTRTQPDNYVFVAALHACAAAGDLQSGKQMHGDVLTCGMEHDMFVSNCLLEMYIKCGSLKDARRVFDGFQRRDVVTWTAMIAGYAKVEGMGQEALTLYSAMHNQGTAVPDRVTFVCLLQACANVGVSALEKGRQLHSELKERRLECDVDVGGSLVNMYAKCGCLADARRVFDGLGAKNVVTWTCMIAGYAQQGCQEAFSLYSAMHEQGKVIPNAVTFVCLLQACANVGVAALEKGRQLHSHIKQRRLESEPDVAGSLVNMYAKCGSLTDARNVFDGLGEEKSVVTWTAMIAGYAQQEGMGKEALSLYSAMRSEGVATPDAVTYVCLLEACASVGALQQGEQLHVEICQGGLESNALIATCLVKMYAQCGRLDVSRDVFDSLPVKSLETWNALLTGYAEHGAGCKAVKCLEEEMLAEEHGGVEPDEVTYICLLTACSHEGLVDQGQLYFSTMEERHGVKPDYRHFTCMVDLFGRSGHLHRAEQMLRASGLAESAVSWTALLSACKSCGDADLGRRCFDRLVTLQPTVATAYVLLASIYANAGRWGDVEWVESLRQAAGARKKPAKACIEVEWEVHEFTVGEAGAADVAGAVRRMSARAKEGGHVPHTQLVVGGALASEGEEEDALCGHAEKLALAYGLLNTPAGSPLLVTKNLRMCGDCHSSTKVVSRVERRSIVVRDGHKVHRFQDGVCSCQDKP